MVYIENGPAAAARTSARSARAPKLSDEEALIVARGEHAYVLLNLFPYNSGHLLVCPYRHVATVRRGDARGGRRDRQR